jgi:hypothetical protein
MKSRQIVGVAIVVIGIALLFLIASLGTLSIIVGIFLIFIKSNREQYPFIINKKRVDLREGLVKREISRCNTNLLIFNILLTFFAIVIFSWIHQDFGIDKKIVLFLILFVFPVYNFYKLYLRLSNYKNHPVYLMALRFGDVNKISKIIEDETKKKSLYDRKGVVITNRFIIIETLFSFDFISVSEICWAYILETKHSINLIPTGTTYGIRVHSSIINQIDLSVDSEEESHKVIRLIMKIAPWTIFGFTEQLKYLWGSNPYEIIKAAARRRTIILHK